MASEQDVEQIKQSISCATFLERSGGWQIDQASSTRAAVKYRRGPGEIIIVNHEGRGWWDPQGEGKGDVFDLARHINPSLNFGEARKVLRGLAGMSPDYPASASPGAYKGDGNGAAKQADEKPTEPVPVRWDRQRTIKPGSPAWRYLTEQRGLPQAVLRAATAQGGMREGPHASAWFAHRDETGTLAGFEIRGPAFKGFSKGGDKTLFQFKGGAGPPSRIAVAEGAINALSLATIERSKTDGSLRADTLYVATGGGIGPHTETALKRLLDQLSGNPNARLTAATDNDQGGDKHATRLAELAREQGVAASRLRPSGAANDWNQMVQENAGIKPSSPQAEKADAADAAPATQPGNPKPTQEPNMSDITQSKEPPRAIRAEASPPPAAPSGSAGSGQPEGNAGAETTARTAAKAASQQDPMQDLLEQMRKLANQMPAEQRENMLKLINGYMADGLKAGTFQNDLFRTRIAWAVYDVEKATGQPLRMSDTLRAEMTDRAFTAPGLENPGMLQLMRTTQKLADPALVRKIRETAIAIGQEAYAQTTPEIDNKVNRLLGQVFDAAGLTGGRQQQAASIASRQQASETKEGQTGGAVTTRVNGARQVEQQAGGARQDQGAARGAPETVSTVRVPTQSFMEGVTNFYKVAWRDRPRQEKAPASAPSPEAAAPVAQPQTQPAAAATAPAQTNVAAAARDQQASPSVASPPAEAPPAPPPSAAPTQPQPQREASTPSPTAQPVGAAPVAPPAAEAPPAAAQTLSIDQNNSRTPGLHAAEALFGGIKPDPVEQARLDAPPPWPQYAGSGEQFNRHANLVQDAAELHRLAPQIQKTDEAAKAAVEAVQGLLAGPAKDIHEKVLAAAKSEPGGINAVIPEMRAEGKYAGLRIEFDSTMKQNPRLAIAYDTTVMALDNYGKQRAALAGKYDELGRDKSEIGKHFAESDKTLGQGISEMPGKEQGQSMLNEIAQKFNEMFRQIVANVRQAIGLQPTAAPNQTQTQGPRPAE